MPPTFPSGVHPSCAGGNRRCARHLPVSCRGRTRPAGEVGPERRNDSGVARSSWLVPVFRCQRPWPARPQRRSTARSTPSSSGTLPDNCHRAPGWPALPIPRNPSEFRRPSCARNQPSPWQHRPPWSRFRKQKREVSPPRGAVRWRQGAKSGDGPFDQGWWSKSKERLCHSLPHHESTRPLGHPSGQQGESVGEFRTQRYVRVGGGGSATTSELRRSSTQSAS